MNRRLHVIVPMAGEGKRFTDAGYYIPKPLIKVDDKEIFRRAVDSIFDFGNGIDYMGYGEYPKFTFIVRQKHIDDYNIDEIIRKYYKDANVLSVTKTTRGALETINLASQFVDADDVVISMDCDFAFRFPKYLEHIKSVMKFAMNIVAPMLMTFYSKDPKYSYAIPSSNGLFNYVYEKKQMSTYAIAGCYFYGDGNTFKNYIKTVIENYDKGLYNEKEIYASLYFREVSKDLLCMFDDMNFRKDMLWSFNTPEDLEKYKENKSVWDK